MTNEQAKQEAIKKAYGECYGLIVKDLDEYNKDTTTWAIETFLKVGEAYYNFLSEKTKLSLQDKDFTVIQSYVVLDELKNIRGNNGWIRIEPDGGNLPDIHIDFIWLRKSDGVTKDKFHINGHSKHDVLNCYSHYKPIKEELKPIY